MRRTYSKGIVASTGARKNGVYAKSDPIFKRAHPLIRPRAFYSRVDSTGGDHTDKKGPRRKRALLATIMLVLAMSYVIVVSVPSGVRADATTDQLNNSIALMSSLLTAMIPLIVILAVFSMIFGMLMGENSVFGRMGGGQSRDRDRR